MRGKREIEEIYERHIYTVYRICFAYMRSSADAEDAAQDTFMRLMRYEPVFSSAEHEKAWLIRVAINVCKNKLKHPSRRHDSLEEHENTAVSLPDIDSPEAGDLRNAILGLPEKYKTCIYLHYYEGYRSVEIAKILKKPESTVRNLLFEARKILRLSLGDE